MTFDEKFTLAAKYLVGNTEGTAKQFGIKTVDANSFVTAGLLADTGQTAKVTDADGKPQRGRPAKIFSLTNEGIEKAKTLKVKI